MMITGSRLGVVAQKIIEGVEPHVGPASIDVRLGNRIIASTDYSAIRYIDDRLEYEDFEEYELEEGEVFTFEPGRLYIAHSLEYVRMPKDLAGLLMLRSSAGRRGLDHLHAGFLEPGWYGQITFELAAQVPTDFKVGERIAQILIFTTCGEAAYQGFYNGQVGPTLAYSA